ncbi:MAG: hypothetical protein V2I43_02860 [Parvularcula sp.]|jgi:hypothetical protein|nr:hypothetical protein [Parvularcula sp.]
MNDQSIEDFWLSGLVIGNRLWRLSLGDQAAGREAQRMISEKMEAAAQGYTDLALGLMCGDQKCWAAPYDTFMAPGRKTLRKNAKRLAGYQAR